MSSVFLISKPLSIKNYSKKGKKINDRNEISGIWHYKVNKCPHKTNIPLYTMHANNLYVYLNATSIMSNRPIKCIHKEKLLGFKLSSMCNDTMHYFSIAKWSIVIDKWKKLNKKKTFSVEFSGFQFIGKILERIRYGKKFSMTICSSIAINYHQWLRLATKWIRIYTANKCATTLINTITMKFDTSEETYELNHFCSIDLVNRQLMFAFEFEINLPCNKTKNFFFPPHPIINYIYTDMQQ